MMVNRHTLHKYAWLFAMGFFVLTSGCVSPGSKDVPTIESGAVKQPAMQASPSIEPLSATATLPPPTATYTPPATPTSKPTNTSIPTSTPTETALPPTPSGDQAIYIYVIKTGTDGPIKCGKIGDTAIPINTGVFRTGDVAADVATALRRLFVKRQWIAGLYNPAYLSNIAVDSVEFKPYQGVVSIRLSGTYVRSDDRCDSARVRAQVWSTIRQFPGIKVVDVLLNGNLLGDILAGR